MSVVVLNGFGLDLGKFVGGKVSVFEILKFIFLVYRGKKKGCY